MEIKIKIPTFFAKYRVVQVGDVFYAQKKHANSWYWLDSTGYAWSRIYKDDARKNKTLEEAIQLIESIKERVVWSGR